MAKMRQNYFMCIQCGKLAMILPRPVGHQYKNGHRKRLYCPHCKVEINCVECKNDEDIFYFKEDFANGLYKEECEENGVVVVGDFREDGYIATERDFDRFCQRECKWLLNQIIYEERCC